MANMQFASEPFSPGSGPSLLSPAPAIQATSSPSPTWRRLEHRVRRRGRHHDINVCCEAGADAAAVLRSSIIARTLCGLKGWSRSTNVALGDRLSRFSQPRLSASVISANPVLASRIGTPTHGPAEWQAACPCVRASGQSLVGRVEGAHPRLQQRQVGLGPDQGDGQISGHLGRHEIQFYSDYKRKGYLRRPSPLKR